ncbi:MAG TPA: hypothetical protein VMZ66_06350 [Aeromicrobium sp.]|nr:hypothetical protein [Aeromicrobium sp.]
MTNTRAIGIYRALFRLYPRRFREEYGADMALLFEAQLRDESAGRVWARGLVDLAITVPAQHLEAHVNRPPNPAIPTVFAALSITGLLMTGLGGTNLGMFGFGLVIAVVSGVLAVASWRRTRAITADRPASAHWWKLVAGGAGVLIATIVAVNVTGEVPEGWWLPMMLTFLAAITTTVAGLILGIARLSAHRPGHAT